MISPYRPLFMQQLDLFQQPPVFPKAVFGGAGLLTSTSMVMAIVCNYTASPALSFQMAKVFGISLITILGSLASLAVLESCPHMANSLHVRWRARFRWIDQCATHTRSYSLTSVAAIATGKGLVLPLATPVLVFDALAKTLCYLYFTPAQRA